MKQVLFDEDGTFRLGTILSEAGASFQVEAAHGKRSKVKAASILLRFDGQSLVAMMPEAQKLSEDIDPQFLWEVCGPDEFGFGDLAREYFGHAPSPTEATAVALKLQSSPVFFYKRGKGRFQAAAEENLKAALAGIEKKKRQQEQVDQWAADLAAGRVPEKVAANLDTLLFKPDKMSLEWRALDQAATAAGLAPPKLLAQAGALKGAEDFLLRRFKFEYFPEGTGFAMMPPLADPGELPEAQAEAFSIDDHETTEIDDAFSVQRLAADRVRIGIHIAAPSLFFGRDHPLEALARERLSTAYFPGAKITMLPENAVEQSTLAAGRRVPAATLYLTVDPGTLEIIESQSALERVQIASNLRISDLETRLNDAAVAAGRVEGEHGEDLLLLWRFAMKLRAARGAADDKNARLDYTFRITGERIALEPRRRDTPIDLLVSELMIHVNSTWGKWLAERGYVAMYRNQRGIKTRMEVEPAAHEWLGVSHYAWSSSPLRRFADLANQRQLVASLRGDEPVYTKDELSLAARDFETTYEAYAEHQRTLERFWCLRYIAQESLGEADATVIRDELVRLEGIPLVCRVVGLPAATVPGTRVRVAFGEPDYWDPSVLCRYLGTISAHAVAATPT
ncbi:ribonuclease catalytic domain-containing protein [Usitatibacter palustris]|uniref:ribonuclease catalytic domain-containing protein n=1 Tax=Usitatibacter palustris TaxID=2732487 RepID=UPI001488906C|nr:ribonuclease catalytic domain-containing protein [Usitatibacter palustris]